MNTNQTEVLKWWHGSRNYQQGIMLLARFCKNKVLIHTLMKPGKEKFKPAISKLYYELPKAVGLNWLKMPALPEGAATEPEQKKPPVIIPTLSGNIVLENNSDKKHIPIISDKPLDDYPKVIRRLKYEYSTLYKQRSISHKKMVGIAEANSQHNITARADLFTEIKAISTKMDYLYAFIGEYEKNGTIPLEEVVWPPEPEKEKLPDDVDELRKKKKNLQWSVSRDKNRLLYQQRTKGKNKKPMPEGPKRKGYELKIKKREKQILEISNKIVDLLHAD